MRRVAFAPAGVVFRHIGRRCHTLLASGAVVALMSLWRAAATVISDLCANYAQDALNSCAGRTGEWLIIAGALAGYAWYSRRRARALKSRPRMPARTRVARAVTLPRARRIRRQCVSAFRR